MPFKALFVIAVTTARMIFPLLPTLPGQEAPKGPQSGDAVKSMTMNLYARTETTEPKANVTLPAGLGLTDKASLKIYPYKVLSDQEESTSKVILKNYWGSSDTAQTGQPHVKAESNEPVTISPEEKNYNVMAAWPVNTKKDQVKFSETASAIGAYSLTTNYTGGTTIDLGSEQDFLAPIAFTDLGSKVDLTKPIKLEWAKVPKALAYFIVAYGGDSSETITWTAGSEAGASIDFQKTALTKEEINKMIADKTLLSPDTTSATIPAEIFKGSSSVMLIITAIGADKIQEKDGIKTQVLVRSIASMPLFSSRHSD